MQYILFSNKLLNIFPNFDKKSDSALKIILQVFLILKSCLHVQLYENVLPLLYLVP